MPRRRERPPNQSDPSDNNHQDEEILIVSRRRSTRAKPQSTYNVDPLLEEESEIIDVNEDYRVDEDIGNASKKQRLSRNKKSSVPVETVAVTKTKRPIISQSKESEKDVAESVPGIPEGFEYLEISINDPHVKMDTDETDLVVSLASGTRKKSTPTYDRALRSAARHTHLLCLLVAYRWKSLALQTPILRAHLLSLLPTHLLRQFSKEIIEDGRILLNALSMLSNWWKNNFTRTKSNGHGTIALGKVDWLPQRMHHIWLRQVAECKSGVDEDLVALFVVILRALGLPTRLIVSLQPLLAKPPSATVQIEDKIPMFWCEVWHAKEGRWVAVDCLRAIVNDRLSLEPATTLLTKIGRQHLFVMAFDELGRSFDVTRRYCSRYYGWTAKLRRLDEAVFSGFVNSLRAEEEAELAALVDGEPLPKTQSGFQGNGRYMLERQLRKYEVFFPPDAGIVGDLRGEPIRLRSVVQRVKSKEAWYTQFGRTIRDGEVPAKVVKLPKKPTRGKKKHIQEWERDLEDAQKALPQPKEYVDQPLWGEWQTIPVQPAVAENGQVPRNKFGNVDLYLPSMLPIGCVWIDDEMAWRAAKDLEIDYAAACVRFAFSGRFAVPNLRGIVICEEYEGALLRRLAEIKEEAANAVDEEAEEEERKKARLERRKKKIKEKIIHEHGLEEEGFDQKPEMIESALTAKPKADNNVDLDDLF